MFTEQASGYAAAHLDTVGERIWRLVEALRWSSPDRRDFSSLEPLLADARRCVSIEKRAREFLASKLEHAPVRTSDTLTRGERWTLIAGMPVAPGLLYLYGGSLGGFNRPSQRLDMEGLRWEQRGVVGQLGRGVLRCVHQGALRRGDVSTGNGSGRRYESGSPAKTLRS